MGGTLIDFKQRLIEIALSMSSMDEYDWWRIYNNRADPTLPNKETPLEELGGISQRQLLIKISEEWMKPLFGQDVFGKALVQNIQTAFSFNPFNTFYVGDGGFTRELPPVFDYFGKENVMLVRIYRKGRSFEGDSRKYLPMELFDVGVDILNNGTLESFRDDVVNSIKWFVRQ